MSGLYEKSLIKLDFLRNFTEQGNFVAISEEFDGTNFYVGKMTQLIYKGMPNT